jgi:hypothetical protein
MPEAEGPKAASYLALCAVSAVVLAAMLPAVLFAAASPRAPVPRILSAVRALPLRSFLVGVLAGTAVLLLLAGSKASPLLGIPALLVLAVAAVLGFLGLVAEARGLGCALRGRDPGAGGAEGGSVAVGWLVLAGLPLLPVAGHVVLLYLALRATGGAVIGLTAGEARPSS